MSFTKVAERSFYAKVLEATPRGERLKLCLECGNCSGICPFGYLMAYPPSRMIAMLRADRFHKLLETDTVWMCVSCYACTSACPSQVPLTPGLMTSIKEELLLAAMSRRSFILHCRTPKDMQPFGESPRKRADWISISPEVKIWASERRWMSCGLSAIMHPVILAQIAIGP
jgi:heterodisulfide reductase subunit C